MESVLSTAGAILKDALPPTIRKRVDMLLATKQIAQDVYEEFLEIF
ncbi:MULTISPECIES: hypothetical protein [Helicobacter]|nr:MULTISPECIES: hypothetical protein [Helicobacter]